MASIQKINLFKQRDKCQPNCGKRDKYYQSCDPRVKGKLKHFDKKLYDLYDKQARAELKRHLGSGITDNPDPYGEDMIVDTDLIPYTYIEVQVYGTWDNIFPYDEPYIYERKMRFDDNTLFVCFNSKYTKAIIFDKTSISLKKYRANTCEYVHHVPWEKALLIDASDLNYDIIKNHSNSSNNAKI